MKQWEAASILRHVDDVDAAVRCTEDALRVLARKRAGHEALERDIWVECSRLRKASEGIRSMTDTLLQHTAKKTPVTEQPDAANA